MANEGCLLGYGNPLLDISVQGNADFLKKYDLKADNSILAEDKHKGMYDDMTETFEDSVEYGPGGATLNSLRIAQWLSGVPKATTFFGCINEGDKYGKILCSKAEEENVNFKHQNNSEVPTGTCAVIVTGTSRSLCANLAAANCFTESHLDVEENWKLVEKAQYYYIAGFPLTVCPAAMLRIAKHSGEKGKTFCTNLSAPFICQFFKDPLMELMPFVDILFGNETEAETFAKEHNFGTEDRKEIAKKIAAMPKDNASKPRVVIITQAEDPIIVAKGGEVTEYPVIPIKPENIVDTNGAGDAFVGGFLAQLVKGESEAKCIKCGVYAANVVIQQSGCTFPAQPDFE
ncbi:adenosine kinase-like isoform X2 [Pecten maximus]|uniref:adenosine kinase-like isoform X2 n=1 Tax=Pecten maximus TaxID=6579 RepID=UPI001458F07F|nr:adenosine kinase-like isoform X2 [Pecten maximus]